MEALDKFLNSIIKLDKNTTQVVLSPFVRRELIKGEHFIKSSQYAKKVAFLEKGYFRGYYESPQNAEYNKHFFKAPCFIGGYASLITKLPTQVSQQALTDCTIWEASYDNLTKLSFEYPKLNEMFRILAEQFFVQKEQREIELVLLNASQRYKIFQEQFPLLEQLIPQYHIASYLGVSPTQLSRIRRKLASL